MSDFQSDRCENVTLFAVEISDQSNMRRAIRIVFDLRDLSRNSDLVALEIDDPIMSLMTAAAATNRDTSVVVATGNSLLRLQQRFFGFCVRSQFIARQIRLISSRR